MDNVPKILKTVKRGTKETKLCKMYENDEELTVGRVTKNGEGKKKVTKDCRKK